MNFYLVWQYVYVSCAEHPPVKKNIDGSPSMPRLYPHLLFPSDVKADSSEGFVSFPQNFSGSHLT